MFDVWLAAAHRRGFMFKRSNNFFEVKGKKGSAKMAKLQEICSATFMIVVTRCSSVLINFQGSVSAKYLLPSLATFIHSLIASLNLNCSIDFAIFAGAFANSSNTIRSSLYMFLPPALFPHKTYELKLKFYL